MKSHAGLLVVVLLLLGPIGARAELQRVEAVGAYGIPKRGSQGIPRDRAIQNGLWEAVSRVALEVMGEAWTMGDGEQDPAELDPDPGDDVTGPSEDEIAVLRGALGDDMLPYARSFRIVDDQGKMPVLFDERPGIETEYVVVVEVLVDVDRVSEALERGGLIAARGGGEIREEVRVELIGLGRYEAFQDVLEALREQLGATRIRALEFSRGRQVLAVEGAFGVQELSSRLSRFESPNLVLEPLGLDEAGRNLRVEARWRPDPETTGGEEASRPSVSSGPFGERRSGRTRFPAGRRRLGN